MKKILKITGALGLVSIFAAGAYLWTPGGPKINEDEIRAQATKYDTRIIRDNFGVPHIFGDTDAAASFGLGYAHAEDDWETIQDVIIAARGMSAQYKGKSVAPQDYLYDLFKVKQAVDAKIRTDLKPGTQSVAKGYADGLSLFALENPDRVLPGVLPLTDIDVVAGFTWATPFFYRLDGYLEDLFTAKDKPRVSPWQTEASLNLPEAVRGSNAFAVAPSRSDDGHTRLIVNSHQPMNGPYAWYEAHMVSGEGMNVAGAGFPGTPIITQGVTPHHGWAHTVNRPDLVDIYALETDSIDDPQTYKLDGKWEEFDRTVSRFRVKLWGPFSLPIKRDVLWSKHGPVLSTDTGHYAVKFAGLGEVKALEQWLEMGKITSFSQWKEVLKQNAVLSFNITYADKNGNIGEIYNAKMPKRIEGPDWEGILPGDKSELIWSEFQSIDALPQLWNPKSGWLFSANSTPFKITDPAYDNQRENYSKTFGIEKRMTNRARRALALLAGDPEISRAELMAARADTKYDPQSNLMQLVVEIGAMKFDDPQLQKAQSILRNWDGDTTRDNRGAALAVITGMRVKGYEFIETEMDPKEALKKTSDELMAEYGRLDPMWGEINRLQRGDVDLPLDGAPDVLRAIYADRDGVGKTGTINAFAGDTHIMVADWDENGVLDLESIHQYGAATLDKNSPHFADQAPLFAEHKYKPMPMTLAEVLKVAKRDYRPGKE